VNLGVGVANDDAAVSVGDLQVAKRQFFLSVNIPAVRQHDRGYFTRFRCAFTGGVQSFLKLHQPLDMRTPLCKPREVIDKPI
jgi:hypothetical protein